MNDDLEGISKEMVLGITKFLAYFPYFEKNRAGL
jgi:hypothetical protein